MGNPIYDAMRGAARPQQNNPMNMMQAFNNFKRTFQGNPEAQVRHLISSGKMSQEQFQQLGQMANQMQSMFK